MFGFGQILEIFGRNRIFTESMVFGDHRNRNRIFGRTLLIAVSIEEFQLKGDFFSKSRTNNQFVHPGTSQAKKVSGCTGTFKSQKLHPISQILRFIAFLCYNFQKSVGSQ